MLLKKGKSLKNAANNFLIKMILKNTYLSLFYYRLSGKIVKCKMVNYTRVFSIE